MKKVTLILVVIALSTTIFSCNRTDSKQDNNSQKSKLIKEKRKKELIISLTIGDEKILLTDASIRNNAMTPGQLSNDYTINATPEGSDKNSDIVAFNLDFTTKGSGEATDTYMTLEKYKIYSISVQIDKIETKKSTYGGVNITSLKGRFQGQLKKRDTNGFPTGELINFNGTFEK